MATRFYLPSTGAADVTPLAPAGWSETTDFDILKCVTTRISSAMTNKTRATSLTATDSLILLRQYVSAPIQAQTIAAGTIKGTIRALESAGNDNIDVIISKIYVVSNDGQTVRGTLLALGLYGPVIEFATSLRAKRVADGDATTEVIASSGDRIVIEHGYSNSNTTGTSMSGTLNFGDDSATDLGDNETDTAANNPFVEFSQNILFIQGFTEADGNSSGVAADSVVGRSLFSGVSSSAGLAASVVLGVALWASTSSSAGVASDSFVGALPFAAVASADGTASPLGVSGKIAGSVALSQVDQEFPPVVRAFSAAIAGTVADSAGLGSALGTATNTESGDGASSSVGAASGVGAAQSGGVASADGVGAGSGVGASLFTVVASSAGTGAASADGSDAAATGSDASAAGAGSSTGVGASIAGVVAASAGNVAVSGGGNAVLASIASSDGSGVALGASQGIAQANGTTAGAAIASATGASLRASVGVSSGIVTVLGEGANGAAGGVEEADGSAAGIGTASAISETLTAWGVGRHNAFVTISLLNLYNGVTRYSTFVAREHHHDV